MPKRILFLVIFFAFLFPAILRGADVRYNKKAIFDYSECVPPSYIKGHADRRKFTQQCQAEFDFRKCTGILNEMKRNECYKTTAQRRRDKEVCYNITYYPERYDCFSTVANRAQDPSICFEIPLEIKTPLETYSFLDIQYQCYANIQAFSPRYQVPLRNVKAFIQMHSSGTMIEKICREDIHPSRDIRVLGELHLQKCGDYYRLSLESEPNEALIIDGEGKKIAACRLIQSPDGKSQWGRSRQCQIECESANLCRDYLLDCSVFDMPDNVPVDHYGKQVEYYRKKIIYDYTKTTKADLIQQCETVNAARQQVP